MIPKRLQYIIDLIIKKFEKSNKTLPAPLLLKGESGVGKSWILSLLGEKVLDISEELSVIPIIVEYQLSAKNIVTQLQARISQEEKKHKFKNEIIGNNHKKLKFLLIWDGLDKLYNFKHDGPSKSPKRAYGAGSPKFQKIQYASELRSFLIENSGKVTIVGSSTHVDFTIDESLPFFNFFNIINVEPLSHDESIEYVKVKLANNQKASKLFDIISSLESAAGVDICDGKISYLNIFSGSLLQAIESSESELKKLINYFYSLFFSKLNPFVDIEIDKLSEAEKVILGQIIILPKIFHLKDVSSQGLNKTMHMKNLVNKNILVENGRGTNRTFSLKSEALRKWISYHKDPNSILLGI